MAVYSTDGCPENCYPDTTILINKLNIKSQYKLDAVEKQITLLRGIQAEQEINFGNPDFDFYKFLHKKLFNDIYIWAGTLRTINISKKGTAFCEASQLETIGKLKFKRLKEQNYLKKMNTALFIDELTDLYHELNMLHPFREGNGRTLRLFITLLVRNADMEINFNKTEPDLLTIATIHAAQGDITLLRNIFEEIISK